VEAPTTLTTDGEYTATIPSSGYSLCTTVRYYIRAVDLAGNTALTPATGIYFQSHIIPNIKSSVCGYTVDSHLDNRRGEKEKKDRS